MSWLRPSLLCGVVASLPLALSAGEAKPAPATKPEARTRFHEYTEKWKTPKNPANPLCVTHLGGKGHEWASGGGFQPDGTIVVVGTAAGPVFELAGGTSVQVLGGPDGSAPADADAKVGQPVKNKDGSTGTKIIVTPFYTAGAPFAVRIAPDGGKVLSAVRLPWGVGSCSAGLVDEQGSVYLAGVGGANLATLKPKVSTPEIVKQTNKAGEVAPHAAYLAKLSPDLSKVLWCHQVPDAAFAPELRRSPKGDLLLTGGHLNVFSPEGELKAHHNLQLVGKWNRGVNPIDNSYAVGWDSNTNTGREPWRQPHLQIHEADGRCRYEYYTWAPQLVGAPSSREVSDSSFTYLNFSDDGKSLMLSGWSDGGNSVLLKSPVDLRYNVTKDYPGLGMSAWGINASSLAYIIKMDPETGTITGHTSYLAYLKSENKPNGLRVAHLNTASDGSTIVCGGSAFGFIQTGQSRFTGGYIGGSYVTIMNDTLSDLRFAAIIPNAGAVPLHLQNYEWASAKAVAAGRHRVLVVSGATPHTEAWSEKPVQPAFGGGFLDAMVVALDLGPAS